MTDQEVLKLVAERVLQDGEPPRATSEQIKEAEAALGVPLPPLLSRLYREIGNGGFGPDYQLLPLTGSPSCTAAYEAERATGHWPAGVLPILDWGCGMYAAVDCTVPQAPVLLFEPNAVADDWTHAWFQDAESLSAWLETWLSGTAWYEEEAAMSEDFTGPQPWPEAERRLS
ncbi:SMI1/KNR4 family protein [Actinomadura violacea]|uniref:SMI1/KNR4 family protein n=1 Tax=Actinomadura violacea TaxID=2819934 RepID=A0ABS3RWE0_9ACTN|nr:SMI1/KNR4 family protein [Actinomadura violacea]MBO2460613.1 SMI1/KNR4 family protein [Actinomadura violacea]